MRRSSTKRVQLFITSTGHACSPHREGLHLDIFVDGERHAFNSTHTPTWCPMALTALVPAKLGERRIQVRLCSSLRVG